MHLFHPIYSSGVHLAAKLCISQPGRTLSGSAAICVLHTFVLEGRSSPEAQSQGRHQVFVRRVCVERASELL